MALQMLDLSPRKASKQIVWIAGVPRKKLSARNVKRDNRRLRPPGPRKRLMNPKRR